MIEDRLNSLMLMYVNKGIKLAYNGIIDMYARRNPRGMLFINLLGDKQLIIEIFCCCIEKNQDF